MHPDPTFVIVVLGFLLVVLFEDDLVFEVVVTKGLKEGDFLWRAEVFFLVLSDIHAEFSLPFASIEIILLLLSFPMVGIPLRDYLLEMLSEDHVPCWDVDIFLLPFLEDLGLGNHPGFRAPTRGSGLVQPKLGVDQGFLAVVGLFGTVDDLFA